ncbi:hypothetical protein FKQ71_17905 [Vibrio sp. B4-12]|nr:hypothetical protein [Vibrio sp. A14(2019)]MDQ2198509.1 hypothetical protein [Vibrio sp. 2017_1457_11]NNN77597.1 hypothetical protein [Vibrio sp. B7]NNN94386.1 hypothetical protein [Vibrio sp. B8-1]NNO09552.1 hypothetical protein [Vibrio sp. B4-12]
MGFIKCRTIKANLNQGVILLITNGSRGTANAWRFLFKSAFVITVVILGSVFCVASPLGGRYVLRLFVAIFYLRA